MSNAKTAAASAAVGATVGLIVGGYGTANVILRSKKMRTAYVEHIADLTTKFLYGKPLRTYQPDYKPSNPFIRHKIAFTTQRDAQVVLARLRDFVSKYESATVADLNDLVGLASDYRDSNWGWKDLSRVGLRLGENGYYLDFPTPEYLN